MKKAVFLSLFFLPIILSAQSLNIENLRKAYYKLDTDSASCAKLYEKVLKSGTTENIINGYKGAITASMANHVKSKQEKIKLFNSGKKLIEQSITTDSANVELRFLRFTIQTNCPKALGYSKQISNDKKYIINHFDSVKNVTIRNKMSEYLLSSKLLSEEEKKKINQGIH